MTPIDESRVQNLYDPLFVQNPDLSTSPGLALEMNANADATEYEVKLRPGVEFHNGKTFGAEDLIYSIRLMSKPANFASVPFVAGIDLNGLKAVNPTTVRIPLKFPDADLGANFVYWNTWIVQDGETDFKNPVGTGPFMFESFEPGTQSVFKKNPNYWVTGKPYVDGLTIKSIDDNNARLNALLSGEIDAMAQLPTAQAKAHQDTGDITVLIAPSPQAMMFYMDTTQAPFTDNNVRQAIRLIADREALVASAINGFGTVGNDIVGKGLPYYDNDLPQRKQDIDQAKSLLKQAGQENLTVLLRTSPIFPGFVEAATLLVRAGQGGRRHHPAEAGSAELVLQPLAALPEDGVRRDAVADPVAQVLLPPVAVGQGAVQRDPLEGQGLERPPVQGDRPDRRDGRPGRVEPGAEGSVRPGRLPELDQRGLGRRRLDQGEGARAAPRRRARQLPLHERVALGVRMR